MNGEVTMGGTNAGGDKTQKNVDKVKSGKGRL